MNSGRRGAMVRGTADRVADEVHERVIARDAFADPAMAELESVTRYRG